MFQLVRAQFQSAQTRAAVALALLCLVVGCDSGSAKPPAEASDAVADVELLDAPMLDTSQLYDASADGLFDEFPAQPKDVLSACPAEPPLSGSWPNLCTGAFSCEYGEECCCQDCKPSIQCYCNGSQLECAHTDFCWMADTKCSPGCSVGQFEGPQGCQTCFDGKKALADKIDAVIAPLNTCVTHTDCAAIKPSTGCNTGCTLAIPVDHTQTALQGVQSAMDGWCPVMYACGTPCASFETPACVEGKCKIVGPCDKDVEPVGTPCDDGDSCTQDDVCIAQNHCKGMVADCNDNNPCTDDFCSDANGCKNQPSKGVCATEVACSLGGLCQAGQCVDGGASGVRVSVPGPAGQAKESDLVRTKDGSYLLTYTVNAGNKARLLKLSDAGAMVWDVPSLGPGTRAFAVGQTADGGVAVSGLTKKPGAGLAATVWYLTGNGTSPKAIDLGVPNPIHAKLAPRPEGGVAVVVTSQPQNTVLTATLVLVGADGVVGKKLELGSVLSVGTDVRMATRTGAIAVVFSANKAPDGQAAESEVRFVRLDATGTIATNVAVSVAGGANWPAGLVAVGSNWVASIGNITYGKDAKTTGHTLLQLSDGGETIWSQATKGGPLLATATGLLTLGWQTDAALGLQAVWTAYDNQGTESASWSVPSVVAGDMDSGSILGVAPANGGGAVVVHSTAVPDLLTWFRFDTAAGCL